jgi:hypothetical protein
MPPRIAMRVHKRYTGLSGTARHGTDLGGLARTPTPGQRALDGRDGLLNTSSEPLNPPSTHVECGFKSRPGHI